MPNGKKKTRLTEIYPGIFMITRCGRFSQFKPPVNIYVIAGRDGLVFDAGYGNRRSVSDIARQVREVERIMQSRGEECRIGRVLLSHSHPDHFSGLTGLQKALGLKIVLTGKMADILKNGHLYQEAYKDQYGILKNRGRTDFKKILLGYAGFMVDALYAFHFGITFVPAPDEIIPDNTRIEINGEPWEVIFSPGHCNDHICLYNEPRGILFSGDNVMRNVTAWLGPPRSNLRDYRETLEKMLDLPNLKVILSAHGSPVTNPHERIREIIEHRERRTADVLDIIRRKSEGVTFEELLRDVYPGGSCFLRYSAEGWVLLTLEELVEKKLVKMVETGKGEIRFYGN